MIKHPLDQVCRVNAEAFVQNMRAAKRSVSIPALEVTSRLSENGLYFTQVFSDDGNGNVIGQGFFHEEFGEYEFLKAIAIAAKPKIEGPIPELVDRMTKALSDALMPYKPKQ